ncbi:antitoxin VapB family protein [Methanogenium cariaci]|jgi:predicted CopG family antitoxin|uniref:antitoxin VapB family protein n=1 Tax=Methanogenium cariaci TaxID=2197 RepID=UPI0007846806|nr:antitoxin VapB family protein [Methanogenium cariaci]
MASKTVNLSEEAYKRLKEWKISDDESFSNVIIRVLPKSRDLKKLLEDAEPDLTEEEAEKLKQDIE